MRIKFLANEQLIYEDRVNGLMLNSVWVKDFSVIHFISDNSNCLIYPYLEKTYTLTDDMHIRLVFSGSEIFSDAIESLKRFQGLTFLDLRYDNYRLLVENADS